MLPHPPPAPQPPRRIGVGIDTSRYGHYAAFLRDDLQPAAPELPFAESAISWAWPSACAGAARSAAAPARCTAATRAAGRSASTWMRTSSSASTGSAGRRGM